MSAQICTPTGEQCYDCADYSSAFACIDKIKISDMAVATELEIEASLDSQCEQILIPADFVPCNGAPYTQAINLTNIISGATGSPLGGTFWTPIDFGDSYAGCWYKFNTDLVITRSDFAEFFTAAGISGDTFTIPGMIGKLPMGAGTGFCNSAEVTGTQNSQVTIGCENLPACTIQINDPSHIHEVRFPMNQDADDGSQTRTIHHGADPVTGGDEVKWLRAFPSATGITATHKVGTGGNGTPVALSVRPWSICGNWYMKLSNSCS